jgi:hypothetical protein
MMNPIEVYNTSRKAITDPLAYTRDLEGYGEAQDCVNMTVVNFFQYQDVFYISIDREDDEVHTLNISSLGAINTEAPQSFYDIMWLDYIGLRAAVSKDFDEAKSFSRNGKVATLYSMPPKFNRKDFDRAMRIYSKPKITELTKVYREKRDAESDERAKKMLAVFKVM